MAGLCGRGRHTAEAQGGGLSGTIQAYADDTAMIVQDLSADFPWVQRVFAEFEQISGLALGLPKNGPFLPWGSSAAGGPCRPAGSRRSLGGRVLHGPWPVLGIP